MPSPDAALRATLAHLRKHPSTRYAEVRFVDTGADHLRVRDGRPEQVTAEASRGVAIRVLAEKAWGFACTADTSEGGMRAAADRALAIARASGVVARAPVAFPEQAASRGRYETRLAVDPFTVPLDDKLAALDAPVRALREGDPRLVSAEAWMDWTRQHKRLLTTEGTDVEQTFTFGACGMHVYARADDGTSQRRSYPTWQGGDGFQGGWERVGALALVDHAGRVKEEALALLTAPPCPAGPRTLLLDSSQVALQLHESCGHPTELDRVLGSEISLAGGSFLQPGLLGRLRYGSPLVTIVADATSEGGHGTFGWDDEGVPAGKHPLVERGLFVNYLSSRETAAALGPRLDGHDARRGLEPRAHHPHGQRLARARRRGHARGSRREHRRRRPRRHRQELEHRRPSPKLSVFVRDRLGDQARPAHADASRPILHGHHARLLGLVRRGVRRGRLAPLGRIELRQGRPDAGDARGTRRGAGEVPRRDDGERVVTGAELLGLCRDVLAAAGEPEAEIYLRVAERGCARFAGGELGQHMQISEPQAVLRVAHGRQVAETMTSRLDRASLVKAVHETAASARIVPEVEGFPGFSGEGEPHATPPRLAEATAHAGPEERVTRLAPALAAIRDAGLVSAGMLETSHASDAVATTRGCARSHDATLASFRVWALETPGAGGAAGYGGHVHRDVRSLRIDEEVERAIRTCKASHAPVSLDEGTYDVVMEPEAVTELLEWLATIAFGAPEVEQGTSPFAGRLGERITGEAIDVVEDPLDATELGFGTPFDREGTPRRPVPLITGGIARAVLYDRTYAARLGATSTGSAVLPGFASPGGVGPTAIAMGGGTASGVEELIAGVERGLYVCRLHYVNGLLEPRRAVMTGLTRDGCFLIEKGKISRPAGNLRFTDSFLEGLARLDGATRGRKAVPTWWSDAGAFVAPAVRMRGLLFNGRSQEPYAPLPG